MTEFLDLIFVKLQGHILVVLILLLKKYVEFGKAIAVNQETNKAMAENIKRIDGMIAAIRSGG